MRLTAIVLLYLLFSSDSFSKEPIDNKAKRDDKTIDTIAVKYSETIRKEDIEKHLNIIASDEYEGRETGKKGQKMAAEYISNHFAALGIPPFDSVVSKNGKGYYQEFPLEIQSPEGSSIKIEEKSFEFLKDYYFFPGFDDIKMVKKELLFVGYGIDDDIYSDYKGIDVKDKLIIILSDEPYNKGGISYLTKETTPSKWTTNWRIKRRIAREKGAVGMFIVVDDFEESLNAVRHYVEKPSIRLVQENNDNTDKQDTFRKIPCFYISKIIANEILKLAGSKQTIEKIKKEISKKGKPMVQTFTVDTELKVEREKTTISSENVLGYIEGRDKKDELVIVTAHYDHLGIQDDEVFNGADDDGSGTVALLELAEAFAMAKADGNGPRRSILFMPVSGEEKGLLGSEYYTNNPVFPIENTVANLNIDMIGRLDSTHSDNNNYVYLIGSNRLSTELHDLSERANATYTHLELDYTFNALDDPNRFYYRSDHYNFAKKNIPVIFYFSGVHEDYHKSTDTVDKIDFQKIEKITRLVYFTAWDLVNRDERIELNEKEEE